MSGPDELRVVGTLHQTTAKTARGHRRLVTQEELDAAADEWEVAIKYAGYAKDDKIVMQNEIDVLRKRLEAADAGLRKYGDHMTYCKGNMDAPCTCGYHDVCRPAVKRVEGRQAWLDDAALAGEKP